MDNDHGITDELRDEVFYAPMEPDQRGRFNAIADRIDAEHERKIGRAAQLLADAEKDRDLNYANWQDCKQKVLQHNITMDELSAEIERLKDELAHRIELPKDADGEYIHIGDMLMDGLSQSFTPKKVKMLMLEGDEWMLNFGGGWCAMKHHEWRHYHAPAVEDVLREMLDKWGELPSNMTNEAIVAEYATKLQLRGDAE